MKLKFEAVFKWYVLCLAALLLWSVWASAADTGTNSPAAGSSVLFKDASLDFGLKHVRVLQYPLMDVPLWQYVASAIYVLLAFLVARVINWLIRGKLRSWAAKTTTKLDDILLELLGGPIKVVAFVILLHIGLRIFPWPPFVEDYISKGLKVLVAISLTYLALKVTDVFLDYWRQRASAAEDRKLTEHLLPFLRNTLKVFVVITAVLLTCEALKLPITSLLASLSVGGLALGLAAQDTLANLFGAVAVFVDKPFRVGDRIKLDQVEGEVESIGMRSTRVRTADGHLVTIPNKTVGNATITNIARRQSIRTVLNIGVTYDLSAERVKRALDILDEIYRGHPMTKEVLITFNKFADSALNIEVVHHWNSTDHKAYLKGLQEFNLRVKHAFDAEGIAFAYPTQTVFVKQISEAGGDAADEARN